MPAKKKVCVVGAGISGLASARELLREGHAVTVMEQSGGVGGQWLYDPAIDGGDPLGVAGAHSSIYASLRLNTAREAIGFSDFPFYPNTDGTGDHRRYPCHGEFLRYIRDFCDAFGLMDAVRLNTKVLRVAMAQPDHDGAMRWMVRYEGEVGTTAEEVFDAVVVAVGQYTQPRLPNIKGMDKWSRTQLHSHSYRIPDNFKDQVVVIVGCHESGKDIALELSKVAMEVHISVRPTAGSIFAGMSKAVSKHHNMHQHPEATILQ
ncbi:unnamed protein product [Urochloa humidicola]